MGRRSVQLSITERTAGLDPSAGALKEKLLQCYYIMDEFCSIYLDSQTRAKEEARF